MGLMVWSVEWDVQEIIMANYVKECAIVIIHTVIQLPEHAQKIMTKVNVPIVILGHSV